MRMSKLSAVVLTSGMGMFLLTGCVALSALGSTEAPTGAKQEPLRNPTRHSDSAGHAVHIKVTFFPDDADQCGPATLASVLTYWGIPSNPQALKDEIYLRRLRGTLPIDLLLAVRARGLRAEGGGGTQTTLKAELDAGRPVVALLNLGWAVFPQGHYVVITGYDEQRQGLYVHSGLSRDVFVPYARFRADWEKTGRWMLRVGPRDDRMNMSERATVAGN